MLTFIIIILTGLISYRSFGNAKLRAQFIFHPPLVQQGQWHRLFSYGLIHADFAHLIFNMLTLYFFGSVVEQILQASFGAGLGGATYISLYISALFISILPTYFKEKQNSHYFGLGASGAVSAVVFAYILINPMNFMGIMFIPVMLPAFLFGIIFVVISLYLTKNHGGNINHTAHIAGGVYGIIFLITVFALFKHINLLTHFVQSIQIKNITDLIRFGF